MAITLPENYGYVLLAATSTFFVNVYHVLLTSKARKASGIKYPNAYASDELALKDHNAFLFNCAQRAHHNFTEHLTHVLGALLISGLRYPLISAGLGAAWSLGRVVYARGYASKGPKGRSLGAMIADIPLIALTGLAAYSSVMYVLEK